MPQSERVDRSGRKLETERIGSRNLLYRLSKKFAPRVSKLSTKEMQLLQAGMEELIERLEDEKF